MYPARKLITEAYITSGIVAAGFQTVTGEQMTSGLDMLNSLLELKAVDCNHNPYFKELDLPLVVGQEIYSIPSLIEAESATFNSGTIRFSLMSVDREEYFATPRVDGITSLPYQYHVERCVGGAKMYIYFLPKDTYLLKIWGKFFIPDITLDTNLLTNFDKYYIEYLTFDLIQHICMRYNVTMQPMAVEYLKTLEAAVTDISPTDYSVRKVSTLDSSNGGSDMFLDANIAGGWRP